MSKEKSILGLQLPTDPRWANAAAYSLEEILTDHAYCEQKAASTCISLIVQYPDYPLLTEKLSPLVTEEWGHFRMVLRELKKRKLKLGRQRKDEYVNELLKFLKKNGRKEEILADKLLLAALIEARSCERFKLLSEEIAEEDLKRFYHDLMVAEAGHYRLFIDLAKMHADEKYVLSRWKEFLAYEAVILRQLTPRKDRMH